ncbi:MAG TPA: hypothetical protein VIU12_30115, partial [Chryseolinea sp.]
MRNTRMKFANAIFLSLGCLLHSLTSLGQQSIGGGGPSTPCAGPNAAPAQYYASVSDPNFPGADFSITLGISGVDYEIVSSSPRDKKIRWLRSIHTSVHISAPGYTTAIINVDAIFSGAPSISISADRNNVCEGSTPITFSAFVTNGDGAILRWYRNGLLAQTGGYTFSQAFQNNDQIYATAAANNSCANGATGTSNTVTLTLKPQYAVDLNLPGPQEVCNCGAVVVGASPSSSGTVTSYSYDWYVDNNHQYQDMPVETCGPDRKVQLILPSGPGSTTSLVGRPYATKPQGQNSIYTVRADVRYTQDN